MKIIPILITAIALSGCATSKTVAMGPNGKPMHFIKCGAVMKELCFEKAAEVCPAGYAIFEREGSEVMGMLNNSSSSFNGNVMVSGNAAYARGFSNGTSSSMLMRGPNQIAIECKT